MLQRVHRETYPSSLCIFSLQSLPEKSPIPGANQSNRKPIEACSSGLAGHLECPEIDQSQPKKFCYLYAKLIGARGEGEAKRSKVEEKAYGRWSCSRDTQQRRQQRQQKIHLHLHRYKDTRHRCAGEEEENKGRGLLKAARIPVPLSMLKLPTSKGNVVGRVACNRYDARQLNCIFIYFYLGKMPTQAAQQRQRSLLPPRRITRRGRRNFLPPASTNSCNNKKPISPCAEAAQASAWMPQEKQEKLLGCHSCSGSATACVCVPSLLPVGWFNELPSPLCAAQLAALSTSAERLRASNNPFSFDFLGSPFT